MKLWSVQEECDFMLENFDDRAADRAGEMEGLTRAKELLSGASLVQEAQKASEASAETEKTKDPLQLLARPSLVRCF